ncbi:uncharacterized protein SEPMUDRAFT_111715 [Sphaerulina musiva SO2202]|uniref:Uncharacterized protein n=1 Tax=Sphaerulina musiva (strain SO2202) TaxID=692275 RepID=M3CXH1_SPHMS|nr:uncharacterized protein SEPMUDRAFT_111715 [Sphaerulina musiva SO2202]EMF08361.1 hypothetical protein SEPMUDRAFT_111715 [Sphaerulina musiva SO2202]
MPPPSSSSTSKPKRKLPASNPLAIRSILSHIDSHLTNNNNNPKGLPPLIHTKSQALAHLAHLAFTEKFPYTGNKAAAAGGKNKSAEAGGGTGGEKFHTAKTLWDAMGYVVRSYKKEEFRNLRGREATLRIFGEGGRMLEGEYLGRIGYEVRGGEEGEEGKGRWEGEEEGGKGRGDDDDDDEGLVQKGGEIQGGKKRWGGEREEMGSKRKKLLRRGGRIIPPLGLGDNGRMRRQSCLLPSCGDSTTLEQQQHQHCTEEQVGNSKESSRKMVVYEPVVNDPPSKKNEKKKKKKEKLDLLLPPPSPSHLDSELQHHLHLLRATISDFSTFLTETKPATPQPTTISTNDRQPLPLANGKISSNLKTLYRNIFQDNNGFWRDAFEDFVVGMKKKKEQEGKKKKKEKEEITPSTTIIQAMIWTFLELELWRILMEHFTFFSSSSSFPSKTIIPPQQLQTIHTQALILQAEMSKKAPSTMMISSEKSSSSSSYYRFFKHSHGSIAYCRRFFPADDGHHHHHHHLDQENKKNNNNPSEEEEEEERDIEKVAFTISPRIERVSSSSSSSSSSPSLSGEKTTVVIEPAVIALLGRSGDG